VSIDICTRRSSRHLEGEHTEEVRSRRKRIYISERFFERFKDGIWRKNDKLAKVVELKRVEQRERIIEEFI